MGEIWLKEITVCEDDIIGFDALYESAQKCKKGVLWKDSVAAYWLRGVEKTMALSKQLKSGDYRPAAPKTFMVTSPKPREIVSISYRDRVYQRSLNDNVVYSVISNSFIYDNFACQKGKGTDAARNRLKSFLREHYRKHGSAGFVAQFDIKSYYQTMPHRLVEDLFARKLPQWAFERARDILREQYEGDAGYNPGSQLVQIAGISALDGMDHFIKERLRAHLYLRYMDDFLIIAEDRAYAERCLESVRQYLKVMGFQMNDKKTRVRPLEDGILFLGFWFRLTDTGRVLMKIDPKRVKAQRKKLRRLVLKAKRTGIPRESVDMAYEAWRNHASKGNSYKLLQRMDTYYRNLWRDLQCLRSGKTA